MEKRYITLFNVIKCCITIFVYLVALLKKSERHSNYLDTTCRTDELHHRHELAAPDVVGPDGTYLSGAEYDGYEERADQGRRIYHTIMRNRID